MIRHIKAVLNAWRIEAISRYRKYKIHRQIPDSQVAHLKPEATRKGSWYGSSYGGFFILPDLLDVDSVVYSFGIGKDITFDKAVIRRHGCQVHGFDPTPVSIDWIHAQHLPPGFYFHPVGIGVNSGEVDFFVPANRKYVSGSVQHDNLTIPSERIRVSLKSLPDIVRELGHSHIDVLKMDIEGAEYDVLEAILSSGIPIDQVLVEFHDRFAATGKLRSAETVGLMRAHGYRIFGTSLSYEEISFVHERKL